ncbi:MAG: PKD domain-containing protein [Saprospiraceae bacterium]
MKKVSMETMRKKIISWCAMIAFLLIADHAQATHIVGGNISYRCLGRNTYEINVTIRRDCFNGDPEAFFDDPASVGIFDQSGQLLTQYGVKGQLLMRLKINDTLSEPIMESLCSLDGINSFCFHETRYSATITLPVRAGGYYFEYQRCCRNMPLVNIVAPLETGASWIVHINDEAQAVCNSSPEFKNWSPIFLCVGQPYDFDHSATDEDGDSLVYKLWTPYSGATKNFPKPQPPNNPDFKQISWLAPYSESNMLGDGGSRLTIDSRTGKLNAIPNTLGQFLIGVLVEEYRNGKLLSTVHRDYEVKVLDCSNLVDARIIAPSLQCDNLTVNFKQNSINNTKSEWFFDFDKNRNATSTEAEPTYKYTDTGTYKVALVVTRDGSCYDTAFQIVRLKNSKATTVDFDYKGGACIDGNLTLSLIDKSTGVASDAKYTWTISYGSEKLTSNLRNPIVTVPNSVMATIKLVISEDGNGCLVENTKSITTSFINPEYHFDQVAVCTGDTSKIQFIAVDSIKGKYNYQWDPSPLIVAGGNTPMPTIVSTNDQSIYLYVTIDNKSGCTSRDSILIISKSKANLSYLFENKCGSLTIKIINSSDALADLTWDFGDGSTSTEREPSHTYAKAGEYTVTLSTKQGCAPALSKKFHIGDFACKNEIDSLNACVGDIIGVNPKANPNYTYKWRPSDKLSNLNVDNPLFTVDKSRTFVADICDKNTGIGLGTFTVIVKTPVSDAINSISDTILVCAGIPVSLNPNGNPNLKYEWSPATGLDNPNAINPKVTVSETTQYSVKVTDPADTCILSKSVLVIIPSKIALDLIPDSLEACTAVPIALNPQGKVDPNLTYKWSPAEFLDNSNVFNPKATISKVTVFTVIITDKRFSNCTVTKTIKIKISLVNELQNIPDSVDVCAGSPTPINPKGDSRFKYEWSPATGLDNANIANPKATVNQTTTYTAKITDTQSGNCTLSKSVKVKTPVSDAINSISDTILACTGNTVSLNPNGNPNLKYEWSPATGLDDPNAINPKVIVSGTIQYSVKVTNPADTCILSKSIIVIIPSKIALDLIPDSLEACIGIPIALNPMGKVDPNLIYKWSPAEFLNDANVFNPIATISTETIFTVVITDKRFSNCTVTKTIKIKIPLVTELQNIPDSVNVCAGIPTPINPKGDPRFKYEWSPATGLDNANIANPKATVNQNTTYTAKITDTQRGNCTLSKSVKVKVAPPFSVMPNYTDTVSCTVTNFKLGVKSNNLKVTFEWFNGTASISKSDTLTVSPATKTTYTVVGTDENGCMVSATVNVDPAKISIKATAPNNGVICQGDSIRLSVNATGSTGGLTYQWTPIDQIQSGANTANPLIKPNVNTSYIVRVANAQGCFASDTIMVKVNPVTTVSTSANPTTISIGESSQITSTNVPGYTYKWSPETDLSNPNIPSPTATPKQTTTYTLTVTSPDGCVQIRSVTITVNIPDCAEPFIFLPNAFSPNGDGKNDNYCLRSNIVATMSLIIYNRWGEKVFETRNQSMCWDGTYRGRLLPPDVYGYYLVVDCINGKQFSKKGNVTIMR